MPKHTFLSFIHDWKAHILNLIWRDFQLCQPNCSLSGSCCSKKGKSKLSEKRRIFFLNWLKNILNDNFFEFWLHHCVYQRFYFQKCYRTPILSAPLRGEIRSTTTYQRNWDFAYLFLFWSNVTIIRQKKTANQCSQWSSFLEKKPRSSMLTFFFHLLKVYGELTFQSEAIP